MEDRSSILDQTLGQSFSLLDSTQDLLEKFRKMPSAERKRIREKLID